MLKRISALVLAIMMLSGISWSFAEETAKESPMLAELAQAGSIPALSERLPDEGDLYVETDYAPEETPVYGGTLRTQNDASGTLECMVKNRFSVLKMTAQYLPMLQRDMN